MGLAIDVAVYCWKKRWSSPKTKGKNRESSNFNRKLYFVICVWVKNLVMRKYSKKSQNPNKWTFMAWITFLDIFHVLIT